MVSFARPQPLCRIKAATARPTQPSTGMWNCLSNRAARSTAVVVMQSFRLSSAVASSALESIFFDSVRLNRFIHSFTPMEASSTTAAMAENSTGVG